MHITYFTDTFRVGGAERFLANVVAGAVGAGHDVTVVSPQDYVLELVVDEMTPAKPVRLRTTFSTHSGREARMTALVRAIPGLAAALNRAKPDLVHINNGGYPGSDLCRAATIAARIGGAPKCVLSVHSPPWPRHDSQPQIQAVADRLVWRSVDAVHVGTAFTERRLCELRGMPEGLGRHISYGVAEPSGTSEAVAAIRTCLVSGNGLLAGMVSATAEVEKGHAVFADALAQAGPNVNAVIVGEHPGDAFIQRLARAGLAERVAVVGRVSAADFGAHLRAIDLLVVPSTAYESLPLVILEAMAAGRPVFASRLSGIPEAVVDGVTGRLFEPGAVEELAALLHHAAEARDELMTMGKAGGERWRAEYSMDAMTTSILHLYERLVGPPSPK